MTPSVQRVGRVTVAVGLIGFGVALLVDNLSGSHSGTDFLLKLWPLLLMGFGVEYLVRTALLHRAGTDVKLRFDFGGAFLLLLVGLFAVGLALFRSLMGGGLDWGALPFGVGPSLSRSETLSIPAQGVTGLIADINVGSVSLQQSARTDSIQVEATYSVSGLLLDRSTVQQELDAIRMNVSAGPVVRLTPELPDHLMNPAFRYVIYAPAGLKIQAATNAGWIDVTGYKGDLDLDSRVGRITVQAGSGNLNATSTSGYIQVHSFDGPVTAQTTVGGLDINDVNGPTQLNSGTGTIAVNEFQGGRLVAESKTGSVRASTRTPLAGDVLLRTQTGAVYLSAPRESGVRATAQTRSGGISVPSFMSVNRSGASSSAVGSTGDGKYTVTLEATTGSVTFNAP